MKETPINAEIVQRHIAESKIRNIGTASIREIKRLINGIEKDTGEKFVRMEMGVPGLPAASIGIEAEIEALRSGVASIYPDIEGTPVLKKEAARFVKLFLDINVDPANCIPTVGSMQGGFAAFLTFSKIYKEKDTTLFIDPGFPVHHQQHKVLGQKFESFDVYNFRGEKLREKLESYFSKGNIHSVLYSNPNNPSWICFTDKELRIIGELATKYNVIIIEDLAYFAMDFRKDYSRPGQPPFQPTVAKYTDNYVMLISSSKAFSYAGQRIAMMIVSNHLFNLRSADLLRYYTTDIVGRALIYGTVYALSAGTTHSTQYALAAIFKAVNDGSFDFVSVVREYGEKARIMKKMFTDNGFQIVYDEDDGVPIADGFYFTFAYPGFDGEELLKELLYYGISAIALSITGSERTEGIRACVSLVQRNQFPALEERLKKFHENHRNGS
ncbi:MAG: pyridoxal phosphate-dependent aminotransferase [Bacteroidales bacterium]|nr:pyridoxal phosphate-dependent aminotransferase [Bacteroidales bacterium]HNW73181.1 pyridoxal phosphate-dependent aminotransferase [Bacteroidales bacterium]HPS51342.1 pyridoxal phosphate-dependent aminotransferase [Bacteroidales bacterium]